MRQNTNKDLEDIMGSSDNFCWDISSEIEEWVEQSMHTENPNNSRFDYDEPDKSAIVSMSSKIEYKENSEHQATNR